MILPKEEELQYMQEVLGYPDGKIDSDYTISDYLYAKQVEESIMNGNVGIVKSNNDYLSNLKYLSLDIKRAYLADIIWLLRDALERNPYYILLEHDSMIVTILRGELDILNNMPPIMEFPEFLSNLLIIDPIYITRITQEQYLNIMCQILAKRLGSHTYIRYSQILMDRQYEFERALACYCSRFNYENTNRDVRIVKRMKSNH